MKPREDLSGLDTYLPSDLPEGAILLHANESPYPPPPELLDEIAEEVRRLSLNRYPDHASSALRTELATYTGVASDRIWVGTGSNEILLDACLAYGGAGRTALLFAPTYSMHHRQAQIAGTRVVSVPRAADFSIDLAAAMDAVARERPDIVFICTPNNPTGTLTPASDVAKIADEAEGLVVVDEAYFEFCGETMAGELDAHPNLLCVRTLSKAFRLAGARLGYGIGLPATLEPLLKVRMPYAQSALSQAAALVALRRRDTLLRRVPDVVIERERLSLELSERFEVAASEANFVFFRTRDDEACYRGLLERGVVIRRFPDGLRVTAGTPAQNDAFLRAIRAVA